MTTTTLASKSVSRLAGTDVLSQVGNFLRGFYAATPASIFMNAVSTMNGVPGTRSSAASRDRV